MLRSWANKITICRILFVPFFILAIVCYSPLKDHLRYAALGIFFAAMGLDVLDGYVARVRHEQTRLGAILDPLADKLLLMSSFVVLSFAGKHFPDVRFPVWLVALVLSRDIVLIAGSVLIYAFRRELNVTVSLWGKLSTFFQALTITFVLLQWPSVWLWYLTAVLAVVSGTDYVLKGVKAIDFSELKNNSIKRSEVSV